jgi:hypothetical protein
MTIRNFRPDEWASVGTAAGLAGVSRDWMRALAKAGKVRGFEIEGVWYVHRKDAAAFERNPEGRGRPKAD